MDLNEKRKRGRPASDVKREKIHLTLSPETVGHLDDRARKMGLTRSELLRHIIISWTAAQNEC